MKKRMGLFLTALAHPAVWSACRDLGLDFVFADLEHGFIPLESLCERMLYGNAIGIPTYVRIPEPGKAAVSKTLDAGAGAILLPMTESAEEARDLVRYGRYPPLGRRSYAGGPHTGYGPGGEHRRHMETEDAHVRLYAQIETVRGVERAGEILAVEGIDGAIVGPADLSISMGIPDDEENGKELAAIRTVAAEAKRLGKEFGIIGSVRMQERFRDDLDMIILATDLKCFRDGVRKAADAARAAIEG